MDMRRFAQIMADKVKTYMVLTSRLLGTFSFPFYINFPANAKVRGREMIASEPAEKNERIKNPRLKKNAQLFPVPLNCFVRHIHY